VCSSDLTVAVKMIRQELDDASDVLETHRGGARTERLAHNRQKGPDDQSESSRTHRSCHEASASHRPPRVQPAGRSPARIVSLKPAIEDIVVFDIWRIVNDDAYCHAIAC
jgi:hypothetical protein